MKKVLLFISLFLVSIGCVNAIEKCTPSEAYLRYMSLSEEERAKYNEPMYCSEAMNRPLEVTKTVKGDRYITASLSDSSYNSYLAGYVNTPEDQGDLGSCWAFSSLKAVESNALKNNIGNYNFSEYHLLYSVLASGYKDEEGRKGKFNVPDFLDGGKTTYVASYFFNNKGQLLESEMPYVDEERKIYSSEYNPGNKLITITDYDLITSDKGVCTSNEINYIKERILNYGSVQASIYMDQYLFYGANNNEEYYQATTDDSYFSNHGILIVGWDDTISKTNFPSANRDGAWIVMNSWGSSWSEDGLFYVSYDDHFICKEFASFYGASKTQFENTYTSADMIGSSYIITKGTVYYASMFDKTSDVKESIKRVSASVPAGGSYVIYISKNNNLSDKQSWIVLARGTSSQLGIKSFDISNMEIEDDYSIIAEYKSTSNASYLMMCNFVDDLSGTMEYEPNKSFYSYDANTWTDLNGFELSDGYISCEPNFFVYTDNVTTSTTDPGTNPDPGVDPDPDPDPGIDEPIVFENAVINRTWSNNSVTVKITNYNPNFNYELYRSTNNKKYTKVATMTSEEYKNGGLTYGKKYYYKVRTSYNGTTKYSNVINVTPKPNKEKAKIYFASTNNIKLSWDRIGNVSGYQIQRSTNNKTWSTIKTITKNSTVAFNNTKLKANTVYYYRVRAYKTVSGKKIYGSWSDSVYTRTAPAMPGLTVFPNALEELYVKTGTSKGSTYYILEASLDGKSYFLLKRLSMVYEQIYNELTLGQRYYFRLKACNGFNNCSGWRNVNVVSSAPTPGFEISTYYSKKITVEVYFLYEADGYEVFRATSKTGKYTKIKDIGYNDSLIFNNATTRGRKYFYKVRSYVYVDGKKVYSPFSKVLWLKSR